MNLNNSNYQHVNWRPYTWFEVHQLFWRSSTDGAWRLLGLIVILLSAIGWLLSQNIRFLTTFLPVALGSFLIPGFTKTACNILTSYELNIVRFVVDVDPTEIREWYKYRFEEYVTSKLNYGAACIFSIIATLAMGFGGVFTNFDGFLLIISTTIMVYATLVCGLGLMSIFYLARMVWMIGKSFSVRVGLHDTNILMTGSMLLRIYVMAAVIWLIYSFSGVLYLTVNFIPLSILSAPAVMFIIGSFVIAQVPLHHRMRDYKHHRLAYLQDQLDSLLTQSIGSLDEQTVIKLELYLQLLSRTAKLPTWPFGYASFSGIVLTAFGAVSPLIINIASQIITSYLI